MFENYILKSNETLDNVANKFKTTIKVLENINNISSKEDVREDMELIVPSKSEEYFDFYTVLKGDSLYQIGRKYNINPELLAALNGLNMDDYIYPNQTILIPVAGYSYYITAEGDTLDEVIKVFNSNKDKFLKENETIYLMAGQLLVNKK